MSGGVNALAPTARPELLRDALPDVALPDVALPDVLAGPILRRVTAREVCVWLATSVPARVRLEVFPAGGGPDDVLAAGPATSVTLGPRLHVHLACARADEPLPAGRLLAYDLAVELEAPAEPEPGTAPETGPRPVGAPHRGPRSLADLGLVGGARSITYGAEPRPCFALPPPGTPLRVLHGSCRLLHGAGRDALEQADAHLAGTYADPAGRPQALLLTGDQIYGDEVAGPLIGHLTALGGALLGEGDARSVPGVADLAALGVYGRADVARDRAGFTSRHAENHLLSLGEYAAVYLVAWNEAVWPDRFATPDEAGVAGATRWETRRLQRRYRTEAEALETARAAVPAVRRLLANVPTYTVFDDHDVTDDWNVTRLWAERVRRSPTGRRVVANALAAFWAFQGWGNQPGAFDDGFRSTIAAGARALARAGERAAVADDQHGAPGGDPADPAAAYEAVLWDFDRWSYLAPTSPPVVMLDTRTQRDFDSDEGAARVIGDAGLARVRDLAREAQAAGDPLVLVSAVPVFGLELQERRQKFLAGKVGPYEIDFEAWHSNLEGLVRFMTTLVDDVGATHCVVLSGDVHYALNVDVSFCVNGRDLRLAQVVSSAVKHSGRLARTLLHLLGRTIRAEQRRLGWDEPPDLEVRPGLTAIIDPLLDRSVNSDEWRANAPVFLHEAVAKRVDGEPPGYRERRRYVGPRQRPEWYVVGDNNVGLVTVDGHCVVHELLVDTASPGGRGRASAYQAAIDLDRPWAPES
ncbi:MAG TPA: hypothetical protein VIL48_07135 [Acidimicrobiales bacterium]